MNNPYPLVVFDWEGTISDTVGPILQTLASEAAQLGCGDIDVNEARQYVDLGLVHALRKICPDLGYEQQEALLQAMQNRLAKASEPCLIPGAWEFIHYLQRAKVDLAIATNKGHHSLLRALQATKLDGVFQVTRSAGQVPAKPCPQMLEEIMDAFGQAPPSTLMIGDSATDMEMAKKVQVTAIGLDFYHQQEEALKSAGALVVFHTYTQLADFLYGVGSLMP